MLRCLGEVTDHGATPHAKRILARWSQPMSAADGLSASADLEARSKRESLWAIGLNVLLVAAGVARRSVDLRSSQGDPRFGDRHGRFAEGPSEIPALGWKDI